MTDAEIQSEAKVKVFVGMMRPPFEDPRMMLLCKCGHTLQTKRSVLEHWQLGHMDYPVYEEFTRDEILDRSAKRESHD